jgi:hypothetical protein
MIIQLLGVALISLLTITPTIQQNNIEQLIAPNIEIQPMTFNTPDANRLWVKNQFSYYDYRYTEGQGLGTIAGALRTNTNFLMSNDIIETFNITLSNLPNIYITDSNFYITQFSSVTGNDMRFILDRYYRNIRGAAPTSINVSFTQENQLISRTTTYYTYTVQGSAGSLSGRIYNDTNQIFNNLVSITNNTVNVPINTTLQQLIQNHLVVNEQLQNSDPMNNVVLYYFTDTTIPLNTLGSYTRNLYARSSWGRLLPIGQFTVNVIEPDTTPPVITGPTSLTFEVGTYSLIEQILNDLFTFTDNVGIDDAYYFPVTSINTVGTFNITVYATDAAGNQTNLPVTITTTAPPPTDTTPPVIIGSDTITRELGQVNNDAQLANVFNITDDFTQPSAIVKTISGTRSYTEAGTYNLTLTATDVAGNIATKQFTFIINVPVIDNEPPVIDSDLIVTITIGDFTDRQEILDFYTTVTDNVELSSVLLVGDINFNVVGDYQLQIIATDTSQNQATKNILVRIKDEIILGNYNPLTDLLSGIFGGALSMIFTIGTINVLGLRLLDAMGVIILGAVLLFIYKAIKGGS